MSVLHTPDKPQVLRFGKREGEVTAREAADIAGVTYLTIHNWIKRGWIATRKSKGRTHPHYIKLEELKRFLEE